MFQLNDQIALVTGGASGIGKGIATALSMAGAKVMVLDIDEENGPKVAEEVNGKFFKTDITNEQQVKGVVDQIVNEFGKIDILAANAGIYPQVLIEDMTEEDWDKVFNLNLKGMFFTVKPVLKVMKEKGYGRVILTSSVTGDITGYPGGAAYGATKAGVIGFLRSAAMEYAKYKITINAVQPGIVATEGLKKQLGELYESAAEYIPMKTLAEPIDIGVTVAFFASKEAKYITGQSLVVDGGQVLPESPNDVL